MKLNEINDLERKKIKTYLSKYKINVLYEINDDGTVDIDGDVRLYHINDKKLLVKFGKVRGEFDVSYSLINSTENFPSSCYKLLIGNCPSLTNLEHLSNTLIMSDIVIEDCNNLISIEGLPKVVNGYLMINGCTKLQSLKGCSEIVHGTFSCNGCENLESLIDGPKRVDRDYCCEMTDLKSFEGIPETVDGLFASDTNYITTFKHLPKQIINGRFNIGEVEYVKDLLLLFRVKGLKEFESDNRPLNDIINKYLKTRDVIGCQDELIEAGFGQYARTK